MFVCLFCFVCLCVCGLITLIMLIPFGARNKNWQAFLCGSSHSHTTPRQCKNIPSFTTEPSWHMCGHAHTPRLTLRVSQTLRPWFWYALPCYSRINGNGVSWTHTQKRHTVRQTEASTFFSLFDIMFCWALLWVLNCYGWLLLRHENELFFNYKNGTHGITLWSVRTASSIVNITYHSLYLQWSEMSLSL